MYLSCKVSHLFFFPILPCPICLAIARLALRQGCLHLLLHWYWSRSFVYSITAVSKLGYQFKWTRCFQSFLRSWRHAFTISKIYGVLSLSPSSQSRAAAILGTSDSVSAISLITRWSASHSTICYWYVGKYWVYECNCIDSPEVQHHLLDPHPSCFPTALLPGSAGKGQACQGPILLQKHPQGLPQWYWKLLNHIAHSLTVSGDPFIMYVTMSVIYTSAPWFKQLTKNDSSFAHPFKAFQNLFLWHHSDVWESPLYMFSLFEIFRFLYFTDDMSMSMVSGPIVCNEHWPAQMLPIGPSFLQEDN